MIRSDGVMRVPAATASLFLRFCLRRGSLAVTVAAATSPALWRHPRMKAIMSMRN